MPLNTDVWHGLDHLDSVAACIKQNTFVQAEYQTTAPVVPAAPAEPVSRPPLLVRRLPNLEALIQMFDEAKARKEASRGTHTTP